MLDECNILSKIVTQSHVLLMDLHIQDILFVQLNYIESANPVLF